ncbi:VanZ family protein [Planococcus sp. SSTMD024]|uniref:VanZ family protein n=1 Tax=Planococcus sp. SSTMD024 TaxID=3242163 RepID=UPI00351E3642
MDILRNSILIVLSLFLSQVLMYYIIDEIIVMFAVSPVPYILGRFLLAFFIFTGFKLLFKEFEVELIYIDLAFVLYLIFLLSATLYRGDGGSSDYNLMPFGFLSYFSEVNLSTFIAALLINLMLFVPGGAYLYIKKIKFAYSWQILLYSSVVIELLQFFTKRGSFDIDDLLLNTAGGCLGFLMAKIVHSRITKEKQTIASTLSL